MSDLPELKPEFDKWGLVQWNHEGQLVTVAENVSARKLVQTFLEVSLSMIDEMAFGAKALTIAQMEDLMRQLFEQYKNRP